MGISPAIVARDCLGGRGQLSLSAGGCHLPGTGTGQEARADGGKPADLRASFPSLARTLPGSPALVHFGVRRSNLGRKSTAARKFRCPRCLGLAFPQRGPGASKRISLHRPLGAAEGSAGADFCLHGGRHRSRRPSSHAGGRRPAQTIGDAGDLSIQKTAVHFRSRLRLHGGKTRLAGPRALERCPGHLRRGSGIDTD